MSTHRSQPIATALLALGLASGATAAPPSLQILAPLVADARTEREYANVLARTDAGATAVVQGVAAPVYSTGVFVRDRVPLALGRNLLRVEVSSASGETAVREIEIERIAALPPPTLPTDRLFIDAASIQPKGLWRLAEGESVEVSFSATRGLVGEARLAPQPWVRLEERAAAPGRYVGRLVLRGEGDREAAPVQLRLSLPAGLKRLPGAAAVKGKVQRSISEMSAGSVGLWHSDRRRVFVVNADSADLASGVHEVRLGGPNLAELPRGTLLAVTGQRDERYRVALSPDTEAWVAAGALEAAPAGTVIPRSVFHTLSVAGNDSGDVITLPWPATLPLAVRSGLAGDARPLIDIELFGTHAAATWITHRDNRRLVRELSVEPAGRDRVRVRAVLEQGPLWGWRIERDAGVTRLIVRAPPRLDLAAPSPLAGLTIALEPGHGGATNLGAVGATGVPEKDINRWTTEALKAELEAAGARVVVVREGDDNPGLRERAQRVVDSGAHLLVSIHANAAETAAGYLRASGTGMFYKHPGSHDLATSIQRRLLDDTGLPDLGVVGNFNYTPIRLVTWMPAVLVEQAYVSHPEEEAKLLDPAFRQRIAKAIRVGLEGYLRTVKRGPESLTGR